VDLLAEADEEILRSGDIVHEREDEVAQPVFFSPKTVPERLSRAS